MKRPGRKYKKDDNTQCGVIVESFWMNRESPVVFTIVDFTKKQSYYVLRHGYDPECFNRPAPFPLLGNIKYEADKVNLIREKVTLNGALYSNKFTCIRQDDGVFLVKAKCVFSSGSPTKCFSDICDEVKFSPAVIKKVLLSDVPMDCWLKFMFVKAADVDFDHPAINEVTFELHSIEQVSQQSDATFKAPWTKVVTSSAGYEPYDPFNPQGVPLEAERIPNLRAYFLSGKAIYIPSKPQMPVLLALKKIKNSPGKELMPNQPIIVNVCYNQALKRFIVYDVFERNGFALAATLTRDNYHEATLSSVHNCPGFFMYGKNGLVHDKFGELADFYNRKHVICNVFHYVDPDERAYTTLEVPHAGTVTLSFLQEVQYEGLFIGNDEFFSPYLHYCMVKGRDDLSLKVGYWYNLTIETFDPKTFTAIVSADLMPKYAHVPSKQTGNVFEFLVDISVQQRGIFTFVVSTYLGAIGVKEAEREKFFKDKVVRAGAVRFHRGEEVLEARAQVRAFMVRGFENVKEGMSTGGYQ